MNTSTLNSPAVVRIWRRRTPRNRADEYEVYKYEAGIKPLIERRWVSSRSAGPQRRSRVADAHPNYKMRCRIRGRVLAYLGRAYLETGKDREAGQT